MKIYFVRHGESEGNTGPLHQGPDTPLTENGRKQAEFVAERFSDIPIDLIVSSTYERAKETAYIINSLILRPIEYSELFVERRQPSEIVGTPKEGPVSEEIRNLMREKRHTLGWRHSDEENFEDLKKRGLDALDFILSLGRENVLVVTHGLFMRMLIACVILGKEMTSHEYFKIMVSFDTKNTGITMCEYKPAIPNERDNPWHIVAWNDHAHLG